MRKFTLIFTVFTILSIQPIFTFGQEFIVKDYNSNNGLPTNMIKSTVLDEFGYVWIATDNGLVRFDGYEAVTYSKELPSPYVKYLYKKKNKDIIVVTDMGISLLHPTPNNAHIDLLVDGSNVLTDSTIRYPKRVFEDLQGRLWIAESEHISLYTDKGRFKRYHLDKKYYNNSFTRSYDFVMDQFGIMWIISNEGYLLYFDEKNDRFVEANLPTLNINTFNEVICIHGRDLWISTDQGILEVSINEEQNIVAHRWINKVHEVKSLVYNQENTVYYNTYEVGLCKIFVDEKRNILSDTCIIQNNLLSAQQLYVDEENRIWKSTDEGLYLNIPPIFKKITADHKKRFVQGIGANQNDIFLLQDGLYKADLTSYHERAQLISPIPNISTALVVEEDKVWVGNSAGELFLYELNNNELTQLPIPSDGRMVYEMAIDYDQNLWIALDHHGGLLKRDLQGNCTKINIETTPSIVYHSFLNELYIGGSYENFLYKYDYKQEKLINLSQDIPIENTKSFKVNDLLVDKNGDVIMATTEGVWSFKNGLYQKIPLGKQYDQSNIKSLELSQNDELWITSKDGLIKLLHDGYINTYTYDSGLKSNTFSANSMMIDYHDKLWIATSHGVYYKSLGEERKQTPVPILKSISINEQTYTSDEQIELAYNEVMKVKANAILFPNNEVYYQNRIVDTLLHGSGWSKPTKSNEFIIPPQKGGEYLLQIKAFSPNGYIESSILDIHFSVNMPWYFQRIYLTTFFFSGILILLIAYYIYKYNIEVQRNRYEEMINDHLSNYQGKIDLQTKKLNDYSSIMDKEIGKHSKQLNVLESELSYVQHDIQQTLTLRKYLLPTEENWNALFHEYILIKSPDQSSHHEFYFIKEVFGRKYLVYYKLSEEPMKNSFIASLIFGRLNQEVHKLPSPKTLLIDIERMLNQAIVKTSDIPFKGIEMGVVMIEEEGEEYHIKHAGARVPLIYQKKKGDPFELKGSHTTKIATSIDKIDSLDIHENQIHIEQEGCIYLLNHHLSKIHFGKHEDEEICKLMQNHIHSHMITLKNSMEEEFAHLQPEDNISLIGIRI